MSDDADLRRNWRFRWLGSIKEFADHETQRRLWIDATNSNPHFTPVECFCCYFDDLNLSRGGYSWAVDEGLVSQEEAAAVRDFHNLADAYSGRMGDYDAAAMLVDPQWSQIVIAAKGAQAALAELIDDPQERRELLNV